MRIRRSNRWDPTVQHALRDPAPQSDGCNVRMLMCSQRSHDVAKIRRPIAEIATDESPRGIPIPTLIPIPSSNREGEKIRTHAERHTPNEVTMVMALPLHILVRQLEYKTNTNTNTIHQGLYYIRLVLVYENRFKNSPASTPLCL